MMGRHKLESKLEDWRLELIDRHNVDILSEEWLAAYYLGRLLLPFLSPPV